MEHGKLLQSCYFEETAELGVPDEQGRCLDEKAPVQPCLVIFHAMLEGTLFAKLFRMN